MSSGSGSGSGLALPLSSDGRPMSLRFSGTPSQDSLRVFEVTPQLLAALLGSGSEDAALEIRGPPGCEAVAVTRDKTYTVRLVENSNTQLLIDSGRAIDGTKRRPEAGAGDADGDEERDAKRRRTDEEEGADVARDLAGELAGDDGKAGAPVTVTVHGSFSRVYELVECVPRLHAVRALLEARPYEGPDADARAEAGETQDADADAGDDDDDVAVDEARSAAAAAALPPLLSFEDLRSRVQASDEQIREGLRAANAIEVDGKWRVLSEAYAEEVFSAVLLAVAASRWPLDAVPEDRVAGDLADEFPAEVVRHALRSHGTRSAQSGTVALDERRVCVFVARRLLAKDPDMDAGEFEEQWTDGVPYGFRPTPDMLHGVALLEKRAAGDRWRFCPVERMPSTAHERFASLFRLRQRWEPAELAAYTADLVPPGMTHDAFLLRHCRVIPSATGDGTAYISR